MFVFHSWICRVALILRILLPFGPTLFLFQQKEGIHHSFNPRCVTVGVKGSRMVDDAKLKRKKIIPHFRIWIRYKGPKTSKERADFRSDLFVCRRHILLRLPCHSLAKARRAVRSVMHNSELGSWSSAMVFLCSFHSLTKLLQANVREDLMADLGWPQHFPFKEVNNQWVSTRWVSVLTTTLEMLIVKGLPWRTKE